MNRAFVWSVALVALVSPSICWAQSKAPPRATVDAQYQVQEVDGGSVVTDLGYNIKVNDGSTLHRRWFVLNDAAAPVQLNNMGVRTIYGNEHYQYVSAGSLEVREPLQAIEVRYLLFDVWGDHMVTLSVAEVRDLQSGTFDRSKIWFWRAWDENDVSQLFTVVSFVARARRPDGRVWMYNARSLLREVEKIKVKLTEKQLEPDREKPKT